MSYSLCNFAPGDLVRIIDANIFTGQIQNTYEAWLSHRPEWNNQVGTVIFSDIYLTGKAQVFLSGDVIHVSKTFLELVQSPSESGTMYQEVRNGTGDRKTDG